MTTKPAAACRPGERVVYADHPVTGEPVAVHCHDIPPKWIYFGDLGQGMQPIGASHHDDPPPPGTTTLLHSGLIEITPVRARRVEEENT